MSTGYLIGWSLCSAACRLGLLHYSSFFLHFPAPPRPSHWPMPLPGLREGWEEADDNIIGWPPAGVPTKSRREGRRMRKTDTTIHKNTMHTRDTHNQTIKTKSTKKGLRQTTLKSNENRRPEIASWRCPSFRAFAACDRLVVHTALSRLSTPSVADRHLCSRTEHRIYSNADKKQKR